MSLTCDTSLSRATGAEQVADADGGRGGDAEGEGDVQELQ